MDAVRQRLSVVIVEALGHGERFELLEDVTLIHGGEHFPGGSMLHWAAGAECRGVVCSADIAMVNLEHTAYSNSRSWLRMASSVCERRESKPSKSETRWRFSGKSEPVMIAAPAGGRLTRR
jgi:hypothetical protein